MNLTRDLGKFAGLLRERRFRRGSSRNPVEAFPRFFDTWNKGKHSWPIDVAFDPQKTLLTVSDQGENGETVHIARNLRTSLYRGGVEKRLKFLWSEYLADEVPITPGDVVLDVGANVGEFSMVARKAGARVFACEPDPIEYRALVENIGPECAFNLALWRESGSMTFYSKNDTGDSSLLEMADYSEKVEVQTLTLDHFHSDKMGGSEIRLIKLEAEGAEPEIIEGGTSALRKTRFVSVDAGPERGMKQENTIVEVLSALQDLGFRLTRFGNHRHVMLLERG